MANTITFRTLVGSGSAKKIVRMVDIVSDGSEETDLILYDNSTFVNDVTKGNLQRLWYSGSVACNLTLEWDQTTDSPICQIDTSGGSGMLDFRPFGGISNPNGSGATGDMVLTTANLDSGDKLTLIYEISQV